MPIALILALLSVPVHAYQIEDVQVIISPRPDSSFLVEEAYVVDFGGEQRHGFYRNIPASRGGFEMSFEIVASVADHSDRSKVTRKGTEYEIKIGDPDRTVSGRHVYRIAYVVRGGMQPFKDAELYWNAVGGKWDVPLRRVKVTLMPPPGVKVLKTTAYTGVSGKRGGDFRTQETREGIVWEATRALQPGEGMTVVAAFPIAAFTFPPPPKRIPQAQPPQRDLETDFRRGLYAGLAVVALVCAILLRLWWKNGRDPEPDASIMTEFTIPADLSPAEAGTLIDEAADQEDVLATLFDLAARGYLTVAPTTDEDEEESEKSFRFTRTEMPDTDLRPHEKVFMEALFEPLTKTSTSWEIRERFARRVHLVADKLYESMVAKGYFPIRPDKVRNTYIFIGSVLSVVSAMLGVAITGDGAIMVTWFLMTAGIGSGLAIIFASWFMPAKTMAGARMARRLSGFKEFVDRVEKERLEFLLKRDPNAFEKILPFAIALGVGKQWASRFVGLINEPPSYYRGSGSFNTLTFYDSLSDSARTMSSVKSDSSSSGGSSGFSSSGSSGGGGGGGGGGAW